MKLANRVLEKIKVSEGLKITIAATGEKEEIVFAGSKKIGKFKETVPIVITAEIEEKLHTDVNTGEPSKSGEVELIYDRISLEKQIEEAMTKIMLKNSQTKKVLGKKAFSAGDYTSINFIKAFKNYKSGF